MAWSELRGKKTVEDANATFIDYLITFIATTGETIPTQGQVITDFSDRSALPSTGLLGEPEAIQISDTIKVTVNQDMITVRFRGYYVE